MGSISLQSLESRERELLVELNKAQAGVQQAQQAVATAERQIAVLEGAILLARELQQTFKVVETPADKALKDSK